MVFPRGGSYIYGHGGHLAYVTGLFRPQSIPLSEELSVTTLSVGFCRAAVAITTIGIQKVIANFVEADRFEDIKISKLLPMQFYWFLAIEQRFQKFHICIYKNIDSLHI